MHLARSALALGLCLSQATAILVAEGSPCSTLCGNVLDSTSPDDIVCRQEDYAHSGEGATFQQCSTCQLRSSYTNGINHDTQWLLYNFRYAVSYCLFGFPENDEVASSPCLTSTSCEPFKISMMHNDLASNTTAYGYCSTWIFDQLPSCTQCLRLEGQHYLSNFLTTLHAGCEQRPSNGSSISIEGSPFSTIPVNVTDPTPTATFIPNYYPGPLSLDTRVGIAFGGLVILLFVSGFFIVCRGRRKRRSFLRDLETKMKQRPAGWPTPINTSTGGAYFDNPATQQRPLRPHDDTPLSQKPLRDWDNGSPASATTEKFHGRYFSPYSSQYNSPDTAVDAKNVAWPVDALDQKLQQSQGQGYGAGGKQQDIGVALGGSEPSPMWQQDVKGKSVMEESYELTEVEGGQHLDYARMQQQHQVVPVIFPTERPVYGYYNPADHQDSPQEEARRQHW